MPAACRVAGNGGIIVRWHRIVGRRVQERKMRMQTSIRLIHWNAAEAVERAERLRALGYSVDDAAPNPPNLIKELAQRPPAALVIDLSRLPSQGRDVGVLLRQRKATRSVPLVFVGGEPEKVAGIRALLPDAIYTEWEAIATALPEAIAHPPQNPIALASAFDGYAGKPLVVKLGIRPGTGQDWCGHRPASSSCWGSCRPACA